MIPKSVKNEHSAKCKECAIRIEIARLADCHFDWIDCPYDCENDYEHWIAKQEVDDVKAVD